MMPDPQGGWPDTHDTQSSIEAEPLDSSGFFSRLVKKPAPDAGRGRLAGGPALGLCDNAVLFCREAGTLRLPSSTTLPMRWSSA